MSDTAPANRDQAALWNEAGGQAWVEMNDILDRLLAPFEATLTDAAFPGEGASVLDIGCGAGATTLAMARRLGPDGLALGADISAPLVAAAKARAEATGLRNAAFIAADAQTFRFDPGVFDAAISRFGVMFFDDPARAFANIRKALAEGGRLAFVCWRTFKENEWAFAPYEAALDLLPPQEPTDPCAPGPFAFADSERLTKVLREAGFRDIAVKPHDTTVNLGESVEDAVTEALTIGPLARAAAELDEHVRDNIRGRIAPVFERYKTPYGITPPAAVCLVSAKI